MIEDPRDGESASPTAKADAESKTPDAAGTPAPAVTETTPVVGETAPASPPETAPSVGPKTAPSAMAEAQPDADAAPLVEPPLRQLSPKADEVLASDSSSSLSSRRASLQSPKQTLHPQTPPQAPQPSKKKRREGALSAMSGFLSFLLLVFVAGAFGLITVIHKLKEPGPLAAEKIVYIPPRSDVPEILARLDREGVIDSPMMMNLALLVEGGRGKLKPGEYLFKKNVSLREVMEQLVSGRQLMHGVTIPEGLTSEQITLRLRENEILDGDIKDIPKEGALLPETYKVARGYPRSKLLAKMQEDQRKLVDQIWARRARDLPIKTPFELVTLASIVEKETGKGEERPRVAAVLVNRLRKGMRLQSDPTIVYGIVGGKATLGRGILRSEVEKWTPYNTYAIDGLPPGPIANPGKASLEAAANPAQSRELYFVADGTGGHVFAETLEQHSRNVQHWRQIERDQKDKSTGSPGDLDKTAPGAPPPEKPTRDRRGALGRIGALVVLDKTHEDYPPGRAMAADNGPTHRLGRFGSEATAFLLGGFEDPTEANTVALAALRPARAYFTHAAARPRAVDGDISRLLARSAGGEDDAAGLGADGTRNQGLAYSEDSDIASYPVSAKARAEQKARAAKLGLSTGSDELPRDVVDTERADPADPTAAAPAASQTPPPARVARPRAFDASEGTALDPLRDKAWDLSSAKTVPAGASFR